MTPLACVLVALGAAVLGGLVGWCARAWWSPWPVGYAVLCPSLPTAAGIRRRGMSIFLSDGYGLVRVLSENEILSALAPRGFMMPPPPEGGNDA